MNLRITVKLTSEDKQVQTEDKLRSKLRQYLCFCLDHQDPQRISMRDKESRENNTLNHRKTIVGDIIKIAKEMQHQSFA